MNKVILIRDLSLTVVNTLDHNLAPITKIKSIHKKPFHYLSKSMGDRLGIPGKSVNNFGSFLPI